MDRREPIPERLLPPSLGPALAHEWRRLATDVVALRLESGACRANDALRIGAEREPQAPTAPAYRLWIGDNLASAGQYEAALSAFDDSLAAAAAADALLPMLDFRQGALLHKAQAAALAGAAEVAIGTYGELARLRPGDADPLFQAGLIAASSGDEARAADLYRQAVRGESSGRTDDPAELARRELARLDVPRDAFAADALTLVGALATALEHKDTRRLASLVSRTHFAVGPFGGHTAFEGPELFDELLRELDLGAVVTERRLLGSGHKLYLPTRGWNGKWFRGDVAFLLTRAPRGWQWTGVALGQANELWADHWRPAGKMTNQALPFEIHAPWPAEQCFTAGGLWEYVLQQATLGIGGALVLAGRRCGFGPRGYYYNSGPTHAAEDAFAIDFTRYRRYVPYDNESGGTPVLAVRDGVVAWVAAGTNTGSSSASNTVDIAHADPSNPADATRFTSRYLHMEGPFKLLVSQGMPVYTGNRLGRMDDTGNSVLDHLHFSMHDRQLPYTGSPYGRSVRPTPMSGTRLEDGDSNTCVCSTNYETVGAKPVIEVGSYAGQNWLITPAALAVGETPPTNVRDQRFLLVLSGVAVVTVKGISGAVWQRETVALRPDLNAPLQYAVARYGLPTPAGGAGTAYWHGFEVEQWAPFAALSSVWNRDHSVNSGFAVDVWRPNPFGTGTDAITNAPLERLFAGIQVDVAVRDSDAYIYRISYTFSLLGRIRFGKLVIL